MSNKAAKKMQRDRIAAAIMPSASSNPVPTAIFDIRHSTFDILRTLNLVVGTCEAGLIR
jgi:hypothetical protein